MSKSVLQQAAELYGLAAGELKPALGGHFTAVYEFTRAGGRYILRITPPNEEIDLPSMQAILAWMDFLARQGAPVTRPILSPQGRLIECIEQDETYLAVVFEKATGMLAEELPFQQWSPALYRAVGRAAGKLHAVARTYTPPAGLLPRPQWDQGGSYYRPVAGCEPDQAAALYEQRKVLERVEALPRAADSYGLIHADFHYANFFVDPAKGTVTIFDFDDCCYGWFAMDTAMILFDLLVLYPHYDKEVFALRFLSSYLEGYRAESPLDAFWLAQLPHFLKLLETGIYLQVYRQHDPADSSSWVGRFMTGRKRRIEQGVPYVDIAFASL